MIKITVSRSTDDKVVGLLVKGHSGAAAYGSDIICAAVSALAQSVILSLTEHLKTKITFDIKDGYLKLSLNDEPTELTEAVFSVALSGFEEIRKNNPKYVSVLNRRG